MLRSAAHGLFGDYELYRILASPPVSPPPVQCPSSYSFTELTDPAAITASAEQILAGLAWYSGPEAKAFALLYDRQLVCLCWYWYGKRYATQRGFWPLLESQAKLVQITTAPSHRRRGLASMLIAASGVEMQAKGFDQLYARVWHNHSASLRAFARAGWRETAFVAGVQPFGFSRTLRARVRYRTIPPPPTMT